ncbi:MAG: aminotransferase class IV [Chloroflexota bacterium]
MSPCYIRVLRDGQLHPVDYTAESLAAAAQHEPEDGVYTVTNTYNETQVLHFEAHLQRMEDSAQRAGIDLNIDRPALRSALRRMIEAADYGDVRLRVTVPRQTAHYILSLEPYTPPDPALISHGVRAITVPDSARSNPAAKTTDWMHQRKQIADSMPGGIYDAILLDHDGYMMEGLGANFYAIREGILRTAGAGVLPGIAQKIVFAIAENILPIKRKPVHVNEIPFLEEAFITSSSRGIIPVTEIDGHSVGGGVPGSLTVRLITAYRAYVEDHLEEL